MLPGQTITVMAPDGSRTVKASIPEGLEVGDSFLVRLAKPIRRDTRHIGKDASENPESQPKFASALDGWLSPAEVSDKADITDVTTPVRDNKSLEQEPEEPAVSNPSFMDAFTGMCSSSVDPPKTQLKELTNDDTSRQSPQEAAPADPQNDASDSTMKETTSDSISKSKEPSAVSPPRLPEPNNRIQENHQQLILVHVPPGLSAGKTMHVEVPGENRTLSVQIPPNVDTFHVSYTPRQNQHAMSPPPPSTYTQNQNVSRQQSPTGQKLLLVRVPPGTPAGTTLHVSVPDEPGRILAAQVPPGNVSEFHVSYEARPAGFRRGTLPNSNPYSRSTYEHQQQKQHQNTNMSGENISKHKKDEQERRDEGETIAC
jgi:hypothetical protein